MKIDKEPQIKVGILIENCIEFTLKGDFNFNDITIQPGNYTATVDQSVISTSFCKKEKIVLKPSNENSTFILHNVKIGIGFHWEQKEYQEFDGELILQIEDGKIRAINNIFLERYLKSVISSEMSAMNDLTLLKVHAIVSRSWLMSQIQKKNNGELKNKQKTQKINGEGKIVEIVKWYDREDHEGFDVCADDHCQRYQGITKITSRNVQNAINETQGKFLVFNNEICDARFSKCCGGISEDFKNVWQADNIPYLTAIADNSSNSEIELLDFNDFVLSPFEAFCNTNNKEILDQVLVNFDRKTNDFFRWQVQYSQNEISTLIKNKSGIDFGTIVDLVPIERGKSGRIIRLKIIGTKKELIVGKELEIRKWLSPSHLFSSAFIVEKEYEISDKYPSVFKLIGAGWGHGVGMCQIGAAVMSQKGYSVNEILKHYFKEVEIIQVY